MHYRLAIQYIKASRDIDSFYLVHLLHIHTFNIVIIVLQSMYTYIGLVVTGLRMFSRSGSQNHININTKLIIDACKVQSINRCSLKNIE